MGKSQSFTNFAVEMYHPEQFHNVPQADGIYFTVPIRYTKLRPFSSDKPFVVEAYDQITERMVVIKKINLSHLNDRPAWKRAQRELYCMLYTQHENIVKIYSTFTPARTASEMTEFYIVREHMTGTMKTLSISSHFIVKSVFFDICRAVQYLHSMNISHRDLKPQNILLRDNGDVKLRDFGHSNVDDPNSNTPYIVQRYYRAPEIICETSDKNKTNVDIWSLGCLLAELLIGRVLFQGTDHIGQFVSIVRFLGNADPMFYQVMNRHAREFLLRYRLHELPPPPPIHYRFPNQVFQGDLGLYPEECDDARDLLFKMLVINPDERINIMTILRHPYLAEVYEDATVEHPPQFLRDFFNFQPYVPPEDMQQEIFGQIYEFGMHYNIFTESRN